MVARDVIQQWPLMQPCLVEKEGRHRELHWHKSQKVNGGDKHFEVHGVQI
jgi:hypothetical protein